MNGKSRSFQFSSSLLVLLIGTAVFALALASCQKKNAAQPAAGAAPQCPATSSGGPAVGMPSAEPSVTVPPDVAKTWGSVVLAIEDKTTGKSSQATVKIGSNYSIPGSDLKVQVKNFLPDFRMSGSGVTSASNNPNNPAVNVAVFEGQKQIFKGWLFQLYPQIHAFTNAKYGLTLKECLKKNG